MRIGVMNLGMWHESQTQAEVLHRVVDEAVMVDELGYHAFWTGEHHFTRHGIVTDTLQVCTAIAAKTSRIRIGSAVVVLPLSNAVRVAEQGAILDILSNGRFELGVGAGYQRREFEGLGIPMDESRARFREAVDIILQCWRGEPILPGQYASIHVAEGEELHVVPTPLQHPRPPLYQAVTISPESIEHAASKGLPIMLGGPTDVLGLAGQAIDYWRVKMVEHGNDPAPFLIPCFKNIYVAPTDEEAAADMAAIDPHWDIKIVEREGHTRDTSGALPKGYEHWGARDHENRWWEKPAETPPLVGSPETVLERLRALSATGVDYVSGIFGMPGMPSHQVDRALQLFAAHVLPALDDLAVVSS